VAARAPEFVINRNEEQAAAVALTGNSAALRVRPELLARSCTGVPDSSKAGYSSSNATDGG